MLRKVFFLSLTVICAFLSTGSRADAWGAAHVGYTHVGPGGVQHYGATAASGPNGAYTGSHYGSYGGGTATRTSSATVYGAGGGYGTAYHASGSSTYGAYHAGGFTTSGAYGTTETRTSGVYTYR